jgi:hypothetical protein
MQDLMDPRELRRLARIGIELDIARLNALLDQLKEPAAKPVQEGQRQFSNDTKRRKPMSAAAKKAISRRMKALWKERRLKG